MITAKEANIISGNNDDLLYPLMKEVNNLIECSAYKGSHRVTFTHKDHNKDELYAVILELLSKGFRVELTGSEDSFKTLVGIIW